MDPVRTILLVEDEPIIRMAERASLESAGYAVVTADSGADALRSIGAGTPIDLVLMDIDLGHGMSGTQAAMAILADHDLPLVFLSSHTDSPVVETTQGITSYGYVAKHSGTSVLLASVRMAFDLFEEKQNVKRSQRLLNAVFDAIQDGITVLDTDFVIRHVNHTIKRWYPAEDHFPGKKCHTVFQNTDRICSFCPSSKAIVSGKTERALVPGGNGTPARWLEVHAHPMIDPEHGKPVGVVEYTRDVTDRMALESERAQQKQYVETIVEASADGFYIVDMDRRITVVNDTYCRMTGYSREELLAMRINDIDAIESAEETLGRIEGIIESGSALFETIHRRKNGSLFDVEISVSCLHRPDGMVLICFVRDITERKRAEEAMLTEQARLASIIRGTNVATWEWNIQTGETWFNERWAEIIGYRLEEISPVSILTWEQFTHPEDLQKSKAVLERHFSGEQPLYEVECRMKHRLGHWVWILDRGSVVSWDEAGAPLMAMGTHQDITERKARESVKQILADATRTVSEYTHDTIDYDDIAETARVLAGAKYAVFNTIEPDTETIVTVALAGKGNVIGRAVSILGFSPVGKRWAGNPQWTNLLREETRITFNTLSELAHHILPAKIIGLTETMLDLGRIAVVAIFRGERLLGNFMFFFRAGQDLANREAIELYTDMVSVVMTRIEAEKRVSGLVGEKEILLKEVQHRVKNNLNTMVSLLSLQADSTESTDTQRALREAEGRFRSMQILYDRLHSSESHDQVSLPDYLTELTHQVVELFPSSRNVHIVMECDRDCSHPGHMIDTKRISSIGLIVNELVTNTMKYAFPPGHASHTGHDTDSGYILRVSSRCSDGQEEICVEDNGVGMPRNGTRDNSPGFGLTMVKALAEQLRGTVRFEHQDSKKQTGTRVIVRFPLTWEARSDRGTP